MAAENCSNLSRMASASTWISTLGWWSNPLTSWRVLRRLFCSPRRTNCTVSCLIGSGYARASNATRMFFICVSSLPSMTISRCTSPVGGECCNTDAADSASLIVSCSMVASTESMVVDSSDGVYLGNCCDDVVHDKVMLWWDYGSCSRFLYSWSLQVRINGATRLVSRFWGYYAISDKVTKTKIRAGILRSHQRLKQNNINIMLVVSVTTCFVFSVQYLPKVALNWSGARTYWNSWKRPIKNNWYCFTWPPTVIYRACALASGELSQSAREQSLFQSRTKLIPKYIGAIARWLEG